MEFTDPNEDVRHARLTGIIAYLWVPGWILALILNGQRRTEAGAFHLRQALGWLLLSFLLFVLIRFRLLALGLYAVGAVYGMLNAVNDERRPLPLVGTYFDQWFRTIL